MLKKKQFQLNFNSLLFKNKCFKFLFISYTNNYETRFYLFKTF